ncbi:hypothetical protein TrVE_jg9583 [Triparma verrucosa]|uniref:Uncharacterized protein n=2 Tax=Triparma TaxID=722752 RepID=A0A9W7A1H7_9STRA|nr:hypothetical protein TrST_g4507 [Triparma strigata]GMH93227.1 hypothetical protein TrVE_jg9583 [Triparma verrucosa]
MSTPLDPIYPGTAITRMQNSRARVTSLTSLDLSSDWSTITRPKILWAAGLKDLRTSRPGEGYTGHSFNDWNHVDATCMLPDVQTETNSDGSVKGISRSNNLHAGIKIASDTTLGPGGSWSTCQIGCSTVPNPTDVAHVQFSSRIAFKLVWCPPRFEQFVLVDDEGLILNRGKGVGDGLPDLRERVRNFKEVEGGKYGRFAFEVEEEGGSKTEL